MTTDPTMGAPEPAPVVPERIEDDPAKPYKAYAAAALTAIGTFIAFWIGDAEPFTAKDAGEAFLAALVASGLTGGATFVVGNPKRVKPLGKADAQRRR